MKDNTVVAAYNQGPHQQIEDYLHSHLLQVCLVSQEGKWISAWWVVRIVVEEVMPLELPEFL